MFIFEAPGVVSVDPRRDSVQNDGRMTSVALIWVPFVPKGISDEIQVLWISGKAYASRARHHILHRIVITWSRTREKVLPHGHAPYMIKTYV